MPARAKFNQGRITVRLDKEAYETLQLYMKAHGLTESKAIRQIIMESLPKTNCKSSKP